MDLELKAALLNGGNFGLKTTIGLKGANYVKENGLCVSVHIAL